MPRILDDSAVLLASTSFWIWLQITHFAFNVNVQHDGEADLQSMSVVIT